MKYSQTVFRLPLFKNSSILRQAFIHRSYLNEQKMHKQSNERLEYLGDAVLELIVSEHLYQKYPAKPEGQLTNLRSKLVQTSTLAWVANKLNLGGKLMLSKGERKSHGHQNPSILADTLEAVIGAVYLDSGYLKAKNFIIRCLIDPFFHNSEAVSPQDYKSLLQEKVQAENLPSPIYKTLSEKGPDHNKLFKVAVILGPKRVATGTGRSKQKAEQQAAKTALEKKY